MDTYEKIKQLCLQAQTKNPIELFQTIVSQSFVHMHGPEHHMIDGACLLSCLHEAGMSFDLEKALDEMIERAKKMPGAICGQWGVCGSASSIGSALSIVHKTSPLSSDTYYQDHMHLVSQILKRIGDVGGPRCCKRNAYLALMCAVDFIDEHYSISLEKSTVNCQFSSMNLQCIHTRCPWYQES